MLALISLSSEEGSGQALHLTIAIPRRDLKPKDTVLTAQDWISIHPYLHLREITRDHPHKTTVYDSVADGSRRESDIVTLCLGDAYKLKYV